MSKLYSVCFGRIVIVEDMDTAISLAKKNQYAFRIVTLKGDFINPSGSITGGSVVNKTVNILGRSREIEELGKQMEELQAKIKQVEKERADFLDLNSSIEEEAQSLEASLQESDIIYATEKQKMVAIEENIARLEARLEKLKQDNLEIDKQKEEKAQEKVSLKKKCKNSKSKYRHIQRKSKSLQKPTKTVKNTLMTLILILLILKFRLVLLMKASYPLTKS